MIIYLLSMLLFVQINQTLIHETPKTEQQIEQQKSSKNRLISIANWIDYQDSEQQIEQQLNNDRTTTEQRLNTLQECKERKERKNDNINNQFETLLRKKQSLFPNLVHKERERKEK